jgi:hypothetical protein
MEDELMKAWFQAQLAYEAHKRHAWYLGGYWGIEEVQTTTTEGMLYWHTSALQIADTVCT